MGRLRDALAAPGLRGIAEVKRRSPSAGELRADADPAALAVAYERAGAAAVSILVDERFDGSWDDLRTARAATRVPLLAKGFFSTEDDLRAARESGADAALLILRDLDDETARRLLAAAAELDLDTLVEAHDADELSRAARMDAHVIGINARDLRTFEIDRRAQLELVASAPRDRIVVAESGIESRAQGAAAELAGADAILIGSALMRAPEPAAKLEELLSRPLVKVCGVTRGDDVAAAAVAGADMIGFVLAEGSPRRADAVLPVPDTTLSVAVRVGDPADDGADLVQLYEREEGKVRGRDAVLLRDGREVARVVDLPWAEEDPAHLERARAAEGRIMLAGGLGPENVRAAIDAVQPWAVDASSALESSPGVKDHDRVRAYVRAAPVSATEGLYGVYGGRYVPETLIPALDELAAGWNEAWADASFRARLDELLARYVGRPTPLDEAERFAQAGKRILLKREDLCHTGAHKINNALGQALLAMRLGRRRIVAETGAGQHGVATATVCARFGLECVVHMGAEDMRRQAPNVERMRLLGAEVLAVEFGTRTLKEATSEAIRDWITNVDTTYYLIGSCVGPHPYPAIVRELQSVIGREARAQALERLGRLPDAVVACVGGGSNAIGLFAGFLDDEGVRLVGVEAAGAASLSTGRPSVLHGSRSSVLADEDGQVLDAHSISAGLDYPGVGPEHAHLRDSGRAEYVTATDEEALAAFHRLATTEGILPALEPAHALARALDLDAETILVGLSGRGDKDLAEVLAH